MVLMSYRLGREGLMMMNLAIAEATVLVVPSGRIVVHAIVKDRYYRSPNKSVSIEYDPESRQFAAAPGTLDYELSRFLSSQNFDQFHSCLRRKARELFDLPPEE
jgi:hypothetical protein